jgi:predicted permease
VLDVILQSAGLILFGVLWRRFTPLGLDADSVRRNLTGVVYVLLLPALVLGVLWRAPLGADALRIALVAASGVVAGLLLAWLWFRRTEVSRPSVGALLLAAAFPNATYLGLPVLEASFGPWARSIAIQYDLFACTPLLLTLGIYIAARFGGSEERENPAFALLKVPPLWAAIAGVGMSITGIPLPQGLGRFLEMLGAGVVPLMLFSIGLGLQWAGRWWARMPEALPVIAIRLVITPALAWWIAATTGLTGDVLAATVLEAAMPSMVLGIVLCDRYHLDTALYAIIVTLTTALSLITLPLWFQILHP